MGMFGTEWHVFALIIQKRVVRIVALGRPPIASPLAAIKPVVVIMEIQVPLVAAIPAVLLVTVYREVAVQQTKFTKYLV